MYDFMPFNMQTQFNLINKSNQSIKLSVAIVDKPSKDKSFINYTYNKNCIFKYSINIEKSHYILNICLEDCPKNHFNKTVLGSFVYNISLKYSVSEIDINSEKKIDLDGLVYGFLQKDFIYSIYKKNSKLRKFKTSYKLPQHYLSLLNFCPKKLN